MEDRYREINDGPQKMDEGSRQIDSRPQEIDDRTQEMGNKPQELDLSPEEMDDRPEVDDGSKIVDASADSNPEPYIGMEFESDKAAKDFYNEYSRRVGFSIRANASYRTKKNGKRNGSVICRTYVCTKEGHHPLNKDSSGELVQNPRPTIREGCKAVFIIKKQESGKWFIAKFEKNHNHPLTSPNKVRVPKRQLIEAYKAAEMGLKDCISYVEKGRLKNYRIDAQLVLDYFKRMQAINPAFFYAIEVDQDGCLSNVFWADTRSRNAYDKFGDVVKFDTTYKKNQYLLPFAPFTGVNHHRHSVLFGSALLSDETESTFVWLFQTWLKAMSGRHPKTIITDQDMVMKAAIAKVFPKTSHCYCKWHILHKVPEKLADVYCDHKDFDQVFRTCVSSETINNYESSWASMLEEYNLKDNDWLKSLYVEREKWVPLYLRGTFFAGMSTMNQSESVNSLFEGYVNSSTTFNEFIKQYELAVENSYEKEVIEDFNTVYRKPFLRTQMPMEEQAASIYTRNNFKKFQEQLVLSLSLSVMNSGDGAIDKYQVSKFDESEVYTVMFDHSEIKAICHCMTWDFEGIPCKHVLAVFRAKNIFSVPSHYILNRWTKDARRGDACNIEMQDDIEDHSTFRFNSLCREALKYAEDGAPSLRSYKEAMGIMQEAMERLVIAKQKIEIKTPESQNSEGDNRSKVSQVNSSVNQATIRDPKYMKTKDHLLANVISKPLPDIASKKKSKTCKHCNVAGHASRTCQALKDSGRNLIMGESSHSNPRTFFDASQSRSQDGSATEHLDPRGMVYRSQDAPITGQIEPRNFFNLIQSGSQYDPVTVHSDPRAMFYVTQCGSQYGAVTEQYEYRISTDASQYNSENTGSNLRLS